MADKISLNVIAHVESDFKEKFGIPRQSGLSTLISKIVFEPEYRVREAFRGLSGYSHIWIIWQFSEAARESWSPTVRPPKLGGNKRMGVFATRSPFRPNPIAMSAVRLEKIDMDSAMGPVLYVSGADIMDGTPVLDIKPYISYADAYPEALLGFAVDGERGRLNVDFPHELLEKIPEGKRAGLISVLSQDPRPGYSEDSDKIYTMSFGDWQISFSVSGKTVTVKEVSNNFEINKY